MSTCPVCRMADPREPCFHNIVDSAVLSDPQLLAIQSKAAEAIDWLYRLNQGQVRIWSFAGVEQAIGNFENQDPEEIRRKAVEALIGAGHLDNEDQAWDDAFVFCRVVRATGKSPEEAKAYVRGLVKEGVVRIEPFDPEGQLRPGADARRLVSSTCCRWVECAPSERG